MILPRLSYTITILFLLAVSPFAKTVFAQTASPTVTPTVTNTPTPTTSNSTPYCASLTSDITTANGAPQTVTFSCAGVDPSGLIMAAEFVFGDGTSQTVEKNVGSPGSISVSHTYNTIGTLGASCRVRDNDNQYSPATESCKRIITIRPAPSKSPTSKATTTLAVTLTPSTTPATAASIATPTATTAVNPTLYPEEDETLVASDTGMNTMWWIGGGVLALIAGILLLRRRKAHPPIPVTSPPIPTVPVTPPTSTAPPAPQEPLTPPPTV